MVRAKALAAAVIGSLCWAPALAGQGPISKYDDKAPSLELTAKRSLSEIERCVIDIPGMTLPNVYRQPDRPTEVILMWSSGLGNANSRLDIKEVAGTVTVRAWSIERSKDRASISACAGVIQTP